ILIQNPAKFFTVEIEIIDVNDNGPKFQEDQLQFRVSELTAVGTRYPLEEARDPDAGANSVQSYELSGDEHFSLSVQAGPGGDQRPELVLAKALDREEAALHELVLRGRVRGAPLSSYVSVQAETGALYALRSFDYEEVREVGLWVRAEDGGAPALSSNVSVRLVIVDENDNAPQLLAAGSGALRGVPASHFVGIDGVRAFLHSYSHEVSLTADSRKSQLRLSAGSCCDTLPARPPAEASGELVATGDHVAEDGGQVSFQDAPPGSPVLRVSASDADAGTNARITYGFGEMPAKVLQKFVVEAESGTITLREALDFEDTRGYTLLVEARDGGGLVAHCKVEVEVLDVNDNAPEVTLTSVSSPVPEDAPPGTVVALVKVRDRDSGENGQVSCELRGEAPLSIVASPGGSYKVVTASALDREQAAEHRVTVVARDRGSPALSSRAALVLEVSDVNDNAPVFEEAAYSAYVAENNAAGAAVVRGNRQQFFSPADFLEDVVYTRDLTFHLRLGSRGWCLTVAPSPEPNRECIGPTVARGSSGAPAEPGVAPE
ncbi:PREDICTED: protocadherin gamma-A9, partial [Pygoscelis adeliae]